MNRLRLTTKQAREAWIRDVYERAKEIDPEEERDWYDLAIGFFLGCGLTSKRATELAVQMMQEGKM